MINILWLWDKIEEANSQKGYAREYQSPPDERKKIKNPYVNKVPIVLTSKTISFIKYRSHSQELDL